MSESYFAHATACVDEGARVGPGTRIWHYSHVCSGAVIGENCVLGQNVYIAGSVRIGNGVKIQNNVSVYDAVTIEDEVFLGPSCVMTNVINPRSFIERKHEYRSTLIQRGATVGANATLVCGHTLGAYAMIGAGAVVTSDVPAHALFVGVPARHCGWVCRCGNRLIFAEGKQEAACGICGSKYALRDGACLAMA